jgi:hypothetical protein
MRLVFLVLTAAYLANAYNMDEEVLVADPVSEDEYAAKGHPVDYYADLADLTADYHASKASEYQPSADEYDFPFARAAAAISSTDIKKEKDVIVEQLKIKEPGPRKPYPPPPGYPYDMPPPGYGKMPPPPPGYPWGMDEEDEMEYELGDDASPVMPYGPGRPGRPGKPYPPFPFPPPPRKCPNMCDLDLYKKCTCLTPATYTKDGRGNCNVGASKLDLRVWCYVDDSNGKPQKVCPDALPSKSKPGFFWSRIACITG